MADFVELTAGETDAKSFLRQALAKKMKDNFTNLNARTTQLEKEIRVFDHFNNLLDVGGDSWGPDPASASALHGPRWHIAGSTNTDLVNANAAKPGYSINRIGYPSSGGGRWANVESNLNLQFDQVTLPIIFEARVKFSADLEFHIGTRAAQNVVPTTDLAGVWLERIDGTFWRFVSFNASRNNGGSITRITNGVWFTIKIEFTDTPGDRALCSIDGDLKETLTAQVPTDDILHAVFAIGGTAVGTGNTDIDRADFGADNISDAA